MAARSGRTEAAASKMRGGARFITVVTIGDRVPPTSERYWRAFVSTAVAAARSSWWRRKIVSV